VLYFNINFKKLRIHFKSKTVFLKFDDKLYLMRKRRNVPTLGAFSNGEYGDNPQLGRPKGQNEGNLKTETFLMRIR